MAGRSAGILLYRLMAGGLEVLLAHMGGPFWARRDEGAWTIPKGEHDEHEDPLTAARREFEEELGTPPPADSDPIDLGEVRQAGGKVVAAWGIRGDFDPSRLQSNTFEMEWPRGSGRMQAFPEVDRVAWMDLPTAGAKIVKAQAELLDRLARTLGVDPR